MNQKLKKENNKNIQELKIVVNIFTFFLSHFLLLYINFQSPSQINTLKQ